MPAQRTNNEGPSARTPIRLTRQRAGGEGSSNLIIGREISVVRRIAVPYEGETFA